MRCIVALSVQVNIQLFLHIFRNFSGHRKLGGIGHAARKEGDKVNITDHLLRADQIYGIVAIVNGTG